MNIVGLLWKNVRSGITTMRFPRRAPVPERLRGMVRFDPSRCTGCAMCRFRCTSGAIQFEAAGKQFKWSYNAGQCTFCGRCVEGCKDHALSQEAESPPVYEVARALVTSYTLDRKTPAAKTGAGKTQAATPASDGATGGA